ncbi:MAG TPA: pilus assembly protein TadG-related protein [Acidobacteriaceae bacterium]
MNAGRQKSKRGVIMERTGTFAGKEPGVRKQQHRTSAECQPIDGDDGESGQTTILMALMLGTFLLGFVALAADVASFYQQKRAIQAAADAAAVAAAEEASYGGSSETAAAESMTRRHGFNPHGNKHAATVTLRTPSTGNYAGNSSFIEVDVSQPVSTIFLGVFNRTSAMTVSARAVASAGQSSPTCLCLEGASGTDLTLNNGSTINMTSCGITVDSNGSSAVQLGGGAYLSASSLGSISTNWDNSSNVNNGAQISSTTKVVQGIKTACHPALPPVPAYNSSLCTADPSTNYGGGSAYSVGPGAAFSTTQFGGLVCYNSLTVGSNGQKVNLNPGIYIIKSGQLHFESGSGNSSNTGGDGVFFYLTGTASLVIDNGANANLTAPTSGDYNGTLIFQDPSDTQPISVQGGSKMVYSGTIFAPSSNITLGNGSNTSISSDIVANTLTVNGGGKLTSVPVANLGTLNISTARLSE